MQDKERRWVARLTPTQSTSLQALLDMPLGIDVWEHHENALVVVASEAMLTEIERRLLAKVERLSTVEDYVDNARRQIEGDH